ncbi:SM-20-related protein [Moraxella catarrhalis]|uniref:SM-20-related protein n=2 Tax=Moraxellaceae TaxID=468 RepID=A0A7Z0UYS2_MORCA|nr:SM-20-related protein [Moraxella catarrhalis]
MAAAFDTAIIIKVMMVDALSMSKKGFRVDWSGLIDNRLDTFLEMGVLVLDEVFDHQDVLLLQKESGFIEYKLATLAQGERRQSIRGDDIRWIDEDCPIGMDYLGSIMSLAEYFNQALYAGIRRSEAHYACYPAGFGYQWHVDNPKGRDERVISAVFYLNDDWSDTDGGEILVIDKMGKQQTLQPKANRLVIFDSNLRHQVNITHRYRFSIATWMRKDDQIL